MANIRSEALSIAPTTTTGDSWNTTATFNGQLHAIQYSPSTSATPSTGGNMLITGARTGLTLLNLDNLGSTAAGIYFPRFAPVTSTAGGTTGDTRYAVDRHPLFNERITVTVSSGSTGGEKAGTVRFFVE